ncbi:Triacylglycerol lipase [Trichostrongylus colubriformis]|uniref:Triacylglycerol lipase n=1 Tax=Trichostrongylus colubriformis TaxID=6319 RepID=A0AAN8IWH3_TRICO
MRRLSVVILWQRHMRLLYILAYFELVVALPFLGKKTKYDELTARKLLNMAAGAYGTEQEACINKTFPAHEEYVVLSVNGYFLNGHLVLWPPVEKVLTDPKYADYKAVFTGHSLGGALATLAAARTAKQGLRTSERITVYTYGEPRVGDAQFATNYDSMIKDSYRVVFRRDIVPHLPACAKDQNWLGDSETSRPCDVNVINKPYHHSTEIW